MQKSSSSISSNSQEWQRSSDLLVNFSGGQELPLEKKGLLIRLNEQAREVFDGCFPHASTRRYVAIQLGKGAAYGTVALLVLTSLGVVGYEIGKAITVGMILPQNSFSTYVINVAMGEAILLGGGMIIVIPSFLIGINCIREYKGWAEEEKKLLASPEPNSIEENLPLDAGNGKKIVHSIKKRVDQLLPHGTVRRFTAIQMKNAATIMLAIIIIGAIGQPIGIALGLDNYAVQALAGGALLFLGSCFALAVGGAILECKERFKEEHQEWVNNELQNERVKLISREPDTEL